jgi:flagellar biosynthesis protein FlhA
MGGDVVIGLILFCILLVVNFMVITKGSSRIAEVAARFSLDAMPGKQMAIDSDMSSGMIDESTARRRRKDLEAESGFYGAMDGAAKFVRGDAIAGLIITTINIIGGLAIGLIRHGLPFSEAASTYTTLTVGDGLVSQIPALLVSTAAGIVVTKGGMEGTADVALMRQLGGNPKPLAMAAGAAGVLALMPGLPAFPFLIFALLAGGGAWLRYKSPIDDDTEPPIVLPPPAEAPISEALRIDMIRLELGYGLLVLAGGETPRLTEQIRQIRRTLASEMGFIIPAVRIQDNMQLGPDIYSVRIKEIEAGRGELRPNLLLVMNPNGDVPDMPGEVTQEPAFSLPARWVDLSLRDEAVFRGCTVVDPSSVLATHLTELIKQNISELLSFAETQKLLDDLPREQQKLVNELIPAQISVGGIQRVLQMLLAERVSIRDLATILEGIQEASASQVRAMTSIVAHVRNRLARQISDSYMSSAGYIPLVTLSPEWETSFTEALSGPPDDRQLAMAPSKLSEFMQRLRAAFDAAAQAGEAPVLLTGGQIRFHVRAIVERIRPMTPVLAQTEIFPRARIRMVGSI